MPIISLIDTQNNAASFSFYTNNAITSTFTLHVNTNHITATAVLNPVVVPFPEHKTNIAAVNKWTNDVTNVYTLLNYFPNKTHQIYAKDTNTNTATLKINNYTFSISYDETLDQITVNPRTAINFTWGEFLKFLNYHNKFINEIINR